MSDFEQCQRWIKYHRQSGWIIVNETNKSYICKFISNNEPISIDIVKIYNDGSTYRFKYFKKYYRGSMPRYLDKQKHLIVEKDNFGSLLTLLDYLEKT